MAEEEKSASKKAKDAKDLASSKGKDFPENTVTVEEVGPARVRIKIEVPQERIEARLSSDLNELRHTAEVPGFRVGRAPRKLIEKRFGDETRDRLKNVLLAEAMEGAIEEHKIKTLGEPDLDLEAIKMPDEGPMCFEVETDIEPKFDLPELKGIAVSKAVISIGDEEVESTVKSMLAREGVYEPVTKGAAKQGDQIIGDLWLKVGDKEITRRDEMALLAGPTNMALMSVELNDLCEGFVGAKVDSQVTAEVTVGEEHADEESRGKKGVAGMDIKEIKRMKIPPLTDEWLKKAGWESQEQFRSVIKTNLERRIEDQVADSMRMQIREYLLRETTLDLPEDLSARQIQQAENRNTVRLMQMGIPEEQAKKAVENKSEETRTKALDDAKAFFILRRIGDDYEVGVEDSEINGQIANMAAGYGMRPEKMHQQLVASGQLETMANEIREVKVLDRLLADAEISEAKPEKKAESKAKAKSPASAKKTATAKKKAPAKKKASSKATTKSSKKVSKEEDSSS